MPSNQVQRVLLELFAVEEIRIVRKERRARSDFDRPRAPCLGNPEFGPKRPSVTTEIEQFGVVILAQRRGHLKARPDDEVLLVVCKLLYGECGSSKQVD